MPIRERFESALGRVFAAWASFSGRHALMVLVLVLAASALVARYTATHLGVNADVNRMFADDVHYRALEIRYNETFPALSENILIVVDGDTLERARAAAMALAERMQAHPELFSAVYLPQGPFFEEHALLYLNVDELEDFADRMAEVQPYLAELARDGTLRGLADLLARGAAAVREGDVKGEQLVPMIERFAAAIDARLSDELYQLSWAEVIAGRDLDVDARRHVIFARPVLDFSDFVAGRRPLQAVRRFASELELDEEHGVRVRVTGGVALSYEEMELVQGQAAMAGTLSFFLVGVILYAALRSLRLMLATLVSLVVGLLWTAGFAAGAIGHLNVISVAFAVLFIGLCVDFSIHFCMRYQELCNRGSSHEPALLETGRTVGSSIALCSLTTAIGFYAFVPTDFAGVAELGMISGTGMLVSLATTLTVLPALMSLGLSENDYTRGPSRLPTIFLPSFPVRYPRTVTAGSLLLGVGALFLLPKVYFDADPVGMRDPAAESVQTFEDLVAARGVSPLDISVVATNLESAEALAERLTELPEVDRAITITDYVPPNQDEKLAIIEDVALFLAPAPGPDGTRPAPTIDEQLTSLRELQRELARLPRSGGDQRLVAAAAELSAGIDELFGTPAAASDRRHDVDVLEESLLASLPSQLATLDRLINASPVALENLPRDLLDRMVARDGSVRVRVFPTEDVGESAALERFVTAIQTVTPDATGSAVNAYEASQEAVRALRQALSVAVVVIAVLLFLIWRTLGDTAMVMAPLALAAVLTLATGVLIDIPFNFADIIVLPLLLGIGVDSGIHLVERYRQEGAGSSRLLETSTAHAVLFSSLTTIASFGTLALASHRGLATMGQLLSVGVALAVACNLLLLPALLELRTGRSYQQTPESPGGLPSLLARRRAGSRSPSTADR